MMKLQNEMVIVLPWFDNDGREISYKGHLTDIAKNFGGYTLLEQKGGWVSDDGELMNDFSERLIVNYSPMASSEAKTKVKIIQELLEYLFTVGGQLAVFIKINNVACIMENNQADWNELTKLLNI